MYSLIEKNKISIGGKIITFPVDTSIDKVLTSDKLIWFNTTPSETGLDWNKIETHQIWKSRCENHPSELFCYNVNGKLEWKFFDQNIVGFGKVIPESKKEKEFITAEHFKKYIEKYRGKELIEVYAANFRYVLDANTGEIYDKMETR